MSQSKPVSALFDDMLTQAQQLHVIQRTHQTITRAEKRYGVELQRIPVFFNLTGRAAGMYSVRNGVRVIRYNPHIFTKYFSDNLANTVAHEVAHYVTDVIHGLRNVKPHGIEWKSVMLALDATPTVTCQYDISDLPLRRQQRFAYLCECKTHELTSVRHNRIQRGRARYICRQCGSLLKPDSRPGKAITY